MQSWEWLLDGTFKSIISGEQHQRCTSEGALPPNNTLVLVLYSLWPEKFPFQVHIVTNSNYRGMREDVQLHSVCMLCR